MPKLSDDWERLRADMGLQGRDWSRAARGLVDGWLRNVFSLALAGAQDAEQGAGGARGTGMFLPWRARRSARGAGLQGTEASYKGLALLAVGSLGRGDMSPGSDLDLLLLHSGRDDVAKLADRIWYPIWDDPMPLDHSVRTLSQVSEAADADLRVALGLLDARYVAGDEDLAAELVALGKRLWAKRVGKWLPEAIAARTGAELAHGDVAFTLEPNLQEGRGGLRDVQLLFLVASVTPVAGPATASPALDGASDLLHSVRVELQRPSGPRMERLGLEDLDRVAAALGITDRETLVHRVATAGRTISWVVEDVSRRALSWLSGPRGRGGSADRALGPALVLRDSEVVVPASASIATDRTLALRAATASAQLGVPIARATMDRLADEAESAGGAWDEALRRAFLQLLGAGPGSTHAIEALDHIGVWERYVPEWAQVRNRPQFNPYHRWTVDRHLLEAAVNATEHMLDVHRPDLLLMGAFLHDIGKGSGADHSEAGAVITTAFAQRAGFSAEDARALRRLVLHHLLVPDTATRRDVEDRATIAYVAEIVEDAPTLELLRALAAADGMATGPAAWSQWKELLVEDLVRRVGALLKGQPVPSGPQFPSAAQRRLMEAGGFQVLPAERELTVVAPDRPGLFSDLTGALALHSIGVLEARASSEAGTALDVFVLDLPDNADPHWDRVTMDIEGAVMRRFNVSEALARRPPPRRARRVATLAPQGARVIVDNDAATNATVIEVRAPDSPGLLHRITAALAGADLDIVSARVATLGNAVVDSFYVQADGAKLPRQLDADRLAQALESALNLPWPEHR